MELMLFFTVIISSIAVTRAAAFHTFHAVHKSSKE